MGASESCALCEYYIKDRINTLKSQKCCIESQKKIIKKSAETDHRQGHKLFKLLIRFDTEPVGDRGCVNPERDALAYKLEKKYGGHRVHRFDPECDPEYL
jgi:hypothetical protein